MLFATEIAENTEIWVSVNAGFSVNSVPCGAEAER